MDMQAIDLSELMSSKIANPPAIVQKVEPSASIRMDTLQQTAAALGAQAGLLKRSVATNEMLLKEGNRLDRIFDFNAMMVYKNVLAPVLTEGRSTYSQNSEDEIRLADRMYKIEQPAKFIPHPPTWRDYLQQNVTSTKVEKPHESLLPKTEDEKAVWDVWVQKGWSEGVLQSDAMFSQGLYRLKRDYSGMIQYKILLKQGLVSQPVVSQSNLGTTGGGSQMNLQDKVYRISAPTNLIADPKAWKNYPID
jgi:defect in organelle trafficking protein DotC